MSNQGLTFLRDTTWDEVFSKWRAREADWGWEEVYQPRGFDTWDAWRIIYCEPLSLPGRRWRLYRAEKPLEFIPRMWVGAFSGWGKWFPKGVRQLQFAELAKNSVMRENDRVKPILADFPKQTTIIVLRCGDDVILFDGTHRCVALAIAAADGTPIETELIVALVDFDEFERELFDRARTQGQGPWEPQSFGTQL